MMETSERLSNAEIDIMRVLWEADEPIKASDITKKLSEAHNWKTQTTHVMLARLSQKGFVCADRSGYSHKFFPAVSEEEYLVSESVQLCDKIGSSVPSMVASLISAENLSEADIVELAEMLEAKRNELAERK